ncbi:MAG: hemL [Jatrophihabitans sp.]|nr:hemL [Jatrophihabitans sp.]
MGSEANRAMPIPVLIEAGEGCRVRDIDGNTYIDTMFGYGALILGHRHPSIEAALHAQLGLGWQFGIHDAMQEDLARLIVEALPAAERVMLCNSGTESTMYAIRAARAYTGKQRIAVFDGAYHGAHDTALIRYDPASPRTAPASLPFGDGIPTSIVGDVLILPFAREAAFDLIRAHRDELAVVLVEPSQSSNPRVDDEQTAFLQQVQAVCRESGVLFLLDEVITGFRLGYSGGQGRLGLEPDLTTLGKIIGGGVPVGAVAGRGEIMDVFLGLGRPGRPGIFSGGSFSGNSLTLAAGIAQLSELREHGDVIYPHIEDQTRRLADAFNSNARRLDVPAQMLRAGSSFRVIFQAGEIRSARDVHPTTHPAEVDLYVHLLDRGVLIPGNRRGVLSAAHTSDDVDIMIAAMTESLETCVSDGVL